MRNAYRSAAPSPRDYWTRYVEANGGPTGVAQKLGIPYPTIAGICNGSRGIGRKTAQRMVESDPDLDLNVLVWVTPVAGGEGMLANG